MTKRKNKNATVLVCDDEKLIRDILHDYLTDRGYKVLLAKNGKECIEHVQLNAPDAILLDIIMPEMDGISVIRQLRTLGSDIPILVLSSKHDLGHSVETRELSLGQFIPKPLRLADVEFMIEAALLEAQDALEDDWYQKT